MLDEIAKIKAFSSLDSKELDEKTKDTYDTKFF